MRNTVALLTILLLGSCLSPDSVNTEHGYYDLSGLIYDQVLRLDSLGFDLQKDAWFEDRTDTDHFTMDSSRWAQELKLFAEADLNSPVLEGLYRVKDSIRDSGSNLMIRRLKLTAPGQASVQEMELYYYREIANIRRIKIHQEESRLLYDSGRDLTIEFSERNGKPLLEDYEITGFQKMVLMDTVRYSIAGKVVH